MNMKTSDFSFDLPESLIAQEPINERSKSRLMIVNRQNGELKHSTFENILDFLKPGDCLVMNNTKVIPARLIGTLENGTVVELLLVKQLDHCKWEVLMKPGRKAKIGAMIIFGDNELKCFVEQVKEEGIRIVRFIFQGVFEEILETIGTIPLPPYIKTKLDDPNRYNTVYAKHEGSIAAPTAGLHFTEQLLDRAKNKGVNIAHLTLHVGIGTFKPIRTESINDHNMHSEFYMLDDDNSRIINESKKMGGRIIAVGTTTVRTLETIVSVNGTIQSQSGWTDIFIYPGYKFKIVDCLITNFHLPESTLIMLVSAFSNREIILNAYKTAVEEQYRFFSFGDAMLII